jgi:hypothetical protein
MTILRRLISYLLLLTLVVVESFTFPFLSSTDNRAIIQSNCVPISGTLEGVVTCLTAFGPFPSFVYYTVSQRQWTIRNGDTQTHVITFLAPSSDTQNPYLLNYIAPLYDATTNHGCLEPRTSSDAIKCVLPPYSVVTGSPGQYGGLYAFYDNVTNGIGMIVESDGDTDTGQVNPFFYTIQRLLYPFHQHTH